MSDAATPAPRERGWRRLLPALAAFLLLPALPLVSMAVPIPESLPLLVTALAACTLLGWWSGGRASLALVWCALAGWVVVQPGLSHSPHDWMARGWALLAAGAFGVVSLVAGARPFFGRALAAVALAGALAGALVLASPSGPGRVRRIVRTEVERRVAAEVESQRASRAELEQTGVLRRYPSLKATLEQGEERIAAATASVAVVYPALLALESLAALALAWSLYHRVSRARIGPPLAPLRDFRFSDQLVWGLIVGITVLVLPSLRGIHALGLNLLVFFGALYALRGLGVLAWFLNPTRPVAGLLVGVALFLLLGERGAFALGLVGVGDTWLDWRSRPRSTST